MFQFTTQAFQNNVETVVADAIYEQQSSESFSKVRVLGYPSVLSRLCRKKGIIDNLMKLLIFLKPQIINSVLTAAG